MFSVFIYEGTYTSDLIVSCSVVIIGLNLTWEGVQPSQKLIHIVSLFSISANFWFFAHHLMPVC